MPFSGALFFNIITIQFALAHESSCHATSFLDETRSAINQERARSIPCPPESCCRRVENPTLLARLDGDSQCWTHGFTYCECCLQRTYVDRPILDRGTIETIIAKLGRLYHSVGHTLTIRSDRKAIVLEGLSTGGGVGPSDMELMLELSTRIRPDRIFIIGNAFGLSTIALALIFPKAKIDVIDAEVEDSDNAVGSQLTRRLAQENAMDVRLTIGFSPYDTLSSLRGDIGSYGFVFIDGFHSEEQLVADFFGMFDYLETSAVLMLHDVDLAHLQRGVERIIRARPHRRLHYLRYRGFHFPNKVGTGLLVPESRLHAFCELAGRERFVVNVSRWQVL